MAQTLTDFDIESGFGTDIWRKPPSTDRFNAPTRLGDSVHLDKLSSTRITFHGKWVHKYDQAGVLLLIKNGDGSQSWIKAGLELYQGLPRLSFVGCDRFADWSIAPLMARDPGNVTVELRREGDENGHALWAYELVLDDAGRELERHPLRECTWPWHDEASKTVQVGAYVARPAPADPADSAASNAPLKVHFSRFEVHTKTN